MPVREGPLLQNLKLGSKPLRRDAIGDLWIFLYKDHVINEDPRYNYGRHDDLLTMVKKQKLRWYIMIYGHNSRAEEIGENEWNKQGKEDKKR